MNKSKATLIFCDVCLRLFLRWTLQHIPRTPGSAFDRWYWGGRYPLRVVLSKRVEK